MTNVYLKEFHWTRRVIGWLIHVFTASGACVGLLSLLAIYEQNLLLALWLMVAAILIDAVTLEGKSTKKQTHSKTNPTN